MAEEDLSGEQLLTLVARALSGAAMAKGAAIEIPDSMRTAFLTGYDAWNNRGCDIKEPLSWPAPRPAAQRDEPPPTSNSPVPGTEPAIAKPHAPGIQTIQEALEIAKRRFPTEPALPHPADMGAKIANIEGLTLSELKALLEDIEHRVTRIQPQVRELNSATQPPAADFGRRERMHEIDDALGATAPEPDPPYSAHRSPSPSSMDESAFLARHAYLRSTRRVLPEIPAPGGHARPATAPSAAAYAAAPAPGGHASFVAPAPVPLAAAAPAPSAAPASVPLAAAAPMPLAAAAPIFISPPVPEPVAVPAQPANVAAPTPFEPAIIPVAAPALPKHFAEATFPIDDLRAAMAAAHDPNAASRTNGALYFRVGNVRVGPQTVIGFLVAFVIITGGLAGLLIYPSLHPHYFYSDQGLKPITTTDSSQSTDPAGNAAAAQVILAAPDEPSITPQPESLHTAPIAAGSKAHLAKTPPGPPVAVWPAVNQNVAFAAPPPVAASRYASTPITATRRAVAPSAPVYVPSASIIGYAVSAPQPIYPRDQPTGINGTVVVQITISKQGQVTDIRTVSGPDEMRPATVQAVQAWRFKPYLVNGNPVEVTTTLGFLFKGQ
jgi:protein TonB